MDTTWSSIVERLRPLQESESYQRVLSTLEYIWTCHKLGILCVVTSEGPKIWPFNNEAFTNATSWTKRPEDLQYCLNSKIQANWQEYYAEKKRLYRIRESIQSDTSKWWLNGHLLCNTTGPWGTRGLDTIQKTLDFLFHTNRLKSFTHSSVPYAFFINRRDFPQFLKDQTKTAHVAFVPRNSDGSLILDKWPNAISAAEAAAAALGERVPILSFYGSDLYADKLWQPPEYWLANEDFIKFTQPFQGQAHAALKASLSSKWPQGPKIQKAVFRGTLTGLYMDLRNVRLRLVKESLAVPHIIDAGLTAWSPRDRISTDSNGNTTVSYEGPPEWLKLVEPMSPWAQAQYATIIYVPGHVASSRMYWHMECQKACGCQIQILDDSSCLASVLYCGC